jgi:RHS repeat-associated protein
MDYLPYGELLSGGNSTSHKFTGKERDSESGLDEFGARYLSSALGRFVSADWSAKPTSVPYADFANPQTLNLYAYVNNNPLSKADPDGHEVDFGVGKKEAQKLLLQNLSKEEQKMFTVEKNKTSGKFELQFKSGAAAKFAQTGQTHTSAWVKLQDAITSDKVMTVNVAKTYADSSGRSVNISQADGGGVTLMHPNGNSEVYVSPKGNPYTLKGTEGQTISDPKNIIMGHELLGHALENAMGGNTGQHRAIEVENILRQEQNLALRSNPEQPHE